MEFNDEFCVSLLSHSNCHLSVPLLVVIVTEPARPLHLLCAAVAMETRCDSNAPQQETSNKSGIFSVRAAGRLVNGREMFRNDITLMTRWLERSTEAAGQRFTQNCWNTLMANIVALGSDWFQSHNHFYSSDMAWSCDSVKVHDEKIAKFGLKILCFGLLFCLNTKNVVILKTIGLWHHHGPPQLLVAPLFFVCSPLRHLHPADRRTDTRTLLLHRRSHNGTMMRFFLLRSDPVSLNIICRSRPAGCRFWTGISRFWSRSASTNRPRTRSRLPPIRSGHVVLFLGESKTCFLICDCSTGTLTQVLPFM